MTRSHPIKLWATLVVLAVAGCTGSTPGSRPVDATRQPSAGVPAPVASTGAAASSAAASGAAVVDCSNGGGATVINGSPARVFCGPATASVTIGKAAPITFASGACERAATSFTVNLGTAYHGDPPKPDYFGLTVLYLADGTPDGPPVVTWTKDGVTSSLALGDAPKVTIASGDKKVDLTGKASESGDTVVGTVSC